MSVWIFNVIANADAIKHNNPNKVLKFKFLNVTLIVWRIWEKGLCPVRNKVTLRILLLKMAYPSQ